MRSNEDERRQLRLITPDAGPAGDLEVTRALAAHRSCRRVVALVTAVRRFFPELDGERLRLGLTRSAAGWACTEGGAIWLHPGQLSRHVVAHELTHLLQARGLVPHGERAADLHALARHVDLVDALPCYLAIPTHVCRAWEARHPGVARLLHDTAVDALREREAGRRDYMRWFETQLESARLLASSRATLEDVQGELALNG